MISVSPLTTPVKIKSMSSIVNELLPTMISLVGGGRATVLAGARRFSAPHLRCVSSTGLVRCSTLEPPDLPRLADASRISLSPQQVQDFAPKIGQVIDWFGQLQAVDLESIEPSLRADTEASAQPREDLPETFENREAIIEAVPSYDGPYIKVPKVINKE